MNIRNEIIEPDSFYHIYNRGINSCNIFQTNENYVFFLKQFSKYLSEICEVYAYCLLPNHFHFLIKVKPKDCLDEFIFKNKTESNNFNFGLHEESKIVSKQFGKFISSYSQSFNKVEQRHGALLESPFKRIKITNDDYLRNLIVYIHLNPIPYCLNYESYPFSSFRTILSNSKTNLKREEVISAFNDIDNFLFCHKHPIKFELKL